MNYFTINILTRADEALGFGHFNRCKILLEEFLDKNHLTNLYVIGKRFNYGKRNKSIKFIDDVDKIQQVSDLVIIDCYESSQSFYSKIFSRISKKILIFQEEENYNIKFISGVINSGISDKKIKDLKCFFGKKYLLLNKKYKYKKFKEKKYIFICFGGSDPLNLLPKYISLSLKNSKLKIIVAIIKPNNKLLKLKKNKRVKIFINPKNLKKIMGEAKFAISSCGTVLTELTSLKKKIVCIALAKNQLKQTKYFNNENIDYLGYYKKLKDQKFVSALKKVENKKRFKNKEVSFSFNGHNLLVKDISNWLKKDYLKEFTKKEIKEEYNSSFKEKFKHKRLHWSSNKTMFNRYKFIKSLVKFEKFQNWLDIGSGDGSFQKFIVPKFKNLKCDALEISSKLYKNSLSKRIIRTNFYLNDFSSFKFKKKYDLITCHGVLSKTNLKIDNLLKISSKFLSRNGILIFDITNFDWIKFKYRNFYREPRHNWFSVINVKKQIKEIKNLKILKIHGFDTKKNQEVSLNKTHCIFFIVKKIL